jgi:hypothetical protein
LEASGSKKFITNAAVCDLALVAARRGPSGSRGLSLFAVESSAPGFGRGKRLDKVGQDQADVAELFFDGVRVGRDELIGEENKAFGYLMQNLPRERLACAIGAHAQAERAFEITLDYAKERLAFRKPIGTFQHNRFELANSRTELDPASTWVDRRISRHVRGVLDPVDAAEAKLYATEAQGRVADMGVQMFGGYGCMVESEIAHCWLDARVMRISASTSEDYARGDRSRPRRLKCDQPTFRLPRTGGLPHHKFTASASRPSTTGRRAGSTAFVERREPTNSAAALRSSASVTSVTQSEHRVRRRRGSAWACSTSRGSARRWDDRCIATGSGGS